MSSFDTDTVRFDALQDVTDDGLVYTTLTKVGTLPPRTPPCLCVIGADYKYVPVQGEQGIAWLEEDERHYPVVVKSATTKKIHAVGRTGDENWERVLDPDMVALPVFALTAAGLVTQSVYAKHFAPRSVTKDSVQHIGDSLHELHLSVNDLMDYLVSMKEDVDGTRLFKRFAKQDVDITKFCAMTYLLTHEYVPVKTAPLAVAPAQAELAVPACSAEEVVEKFYFRARDHGFFSDIRSELAQLRAYDTYFRTTSPGREAAKAALDQILFQEN